MSLGELVAAPVLRRELRARMLDWRTFGVLTAYLTVLGAVEAVFLLLNGPASSVSGGRLFERLVVAQLALALVLTPLVTTGAVSGERQRGTWDLLLLTPVSPFAIVCNKLVSRMAFLLLLQVVALPFIAVAFLFGDLNLADALPAQIVLLGTTLLFAAVTLTASVLAPRTLLAAAGALSLVLLLSGVLTLILSGGVRGWQPLAAGGTQTSVILPVVAALDPVAALDSALPGRSITTSIPGVRHSVGPDVWKSFLTLAVVLSTLCVAGATLLVRSRPEKWTGG
ncbi:MAG: ABC transporter permease [Chloroflexota bacterium]|nr:MAG: hypothetical protein DLM70_13070 [Chloroflexota bacterium]